MQFLVLSRRHSDRYSPEEFAEQLPAEAARIREFYSRGIVRQIWLRDDLPGAAFLVEARSLPAARATVDSLPLARAGMSEFTVVPLRPYGGFGGQS